LNLTKLINILNNTFLSFITEKKGRPFKKFWICWTWKQEKEEEINKFDNKLCY
jgi:hypothetical protein